MSSFLKDQIENVKLASYLQILEDNKDTIQ